MSLQTLKNLYAQHPLLAQQGGENVLSHPFQCFQNLLGAAPAFIIAQVHSHTCFNHVVVCNSKEEAAYFHNDIENITGALDVCYFPDSFKKTGVIKELNSSHLMLRGETLMKFNGSKEADKTIRKKIIVSHPEALFEKVVNQTSFTKNTIFFKVSLEIDLKFVAEFLVEMGFSKEDFVYEPGQFAIRGGILDIYSFGNEKPYRIELFGNEIDSIRIFDPETQLSERKLLQVNIVPNIETQFDTQEKISLLDYLPDNTIYWFADLELCKTQMLKMQESLAETNSITTISIDHEEETIKELNRNDFENVADWLYKLAKKPVIEWHGNSLAQNLPISNCNTIAFHTKEQPSFNRNFDLLIKDLRSKIAEGYQLFIFAEQPKQLERIASIFTDLQADILFSPIPISLSKGFIDTDLKIACYTDHQIFQRYHKYKIKQAYTRGKALSLRAIRELQPGDFVTHIDHGVGVYSGLQKIDVNGNMQEAIRIIYRDNDVLYVNINSLHKITKFTGKDGVPPKVHKLGNDTWEKAKNKAKKQVKDIAEKLIKLYAVRKASQGFAHNPDTYLQTELEASFMYEDTPDQSKAVDDVKRDMEKPTPMDRLVCGDVGFGKTEVAVRAAFKTVADGKQAAVLVPTTILAYQHFQTFSERLKDFPCTVDFINRFKTAKQKKETFEKLANGKIDIIIGTHGLLGKDVKFKNLGILVIDEEQKFGVGAKEKIRELKHSVDTLTLTATPIPRTLQFSLMGARDLSIINTPPPNRQPVNTEIAVFNDELIRDAINYETERGGQVFFIHNRVKALPEMKAYLQNLCPDLSFALAHGQMEGDQLEDTILDFMAHKYDVLLCTNIVESGVDISNVNTIFINNAHQFGLSDLHQLRGRVGRSNKKAFCYLLAPPMSMLPGDSRKRLQTLEQFSELGSGFQIAMRDLDIRGAGNMLGGEQSGFISDIGFEMYQKILNETIRDLKQNEFKELFAEDIHRLQDYVSDCTVDTDQDIMIPDTYVQNITERLNLYTTLDNCENAQELHIFTEGLSDRFGKLPTSVINLCTALQCRWIAKELGFERLILKNDQLKLYFVGNPSSAYFESQTFTNILQNIQSSIKGARLKNVGKTSLLTIDNIKNLPQALHTLGVLQGGE